ncbi:unnamed protein product [Brassica oleracea]|uniref:Uncharacterized protein n=2 Tax=Brassica oleracea TaxID=3712 RepID=A0A0D3ARW2_BRAOL|nr:unnamed protein product [Brassica oleracea]
MQFYPGTLITIQPSHYGDFFELRKEIPKSRLCKNSLSINPWYFCPTQIGVPKLWAHVGALERLRSSSDLKEVYDRNRHRLRETEHHTEDGWAYFFPELESTSSSSEENRSKKQIDDNQRRISFILLMRINI